MLYCILFIFSHTIPYKSRRFQLCKRLSDYLIATANKLDQKLLELTADIAGLETDDFNFLYDDHYFDVPIDWINNYIDILFEKHNNSKRICSEDNIVGNVNDNTNDNANDNTNDNANDNTNDNVNDNQDDDFILNDGDIYSDNSGNSGNSGNNGNSDNSDNNGNEDMSAYNTIVLTFFNY